MIKKPLPRAAARLKIPELKRLIVSRGDTVVIDSSLEEAFARLEEEIKRQTERQQKRFEKSAVKEKQPTQTEPAEGTHDQETSPSQGTTENASPSGQQ